MPENTGYMIAAYAILGVLYVGYAGYLLLRGKRQRER
jgi:hypothetical protein